MPRATAIKRAEERRVVKLSTKPAAARASKTWDPKSIGHWFERLDSLGSVAVLVAGCCVATGLMVRHTVFNDYLAVLDANVRLVSGNVASCVRSGRTLDTRPSVPLCRDPVDGSVVSTDSEAFPAAKPKPAASAANASAAPAQPAKKPMPALVANYGRHYVVPFPMTPPVLKLVAPPAAQSPRPSQKAAAIARTPTSTASTTSSQALSSKALPNPNDYNPATMVPDAADYAPGKATPSKAARAK